MASVHEGHFFQFNVIALVMNCLFLIENIFSLRIESMSRHRRALLLHSAAFTTGFGGPVGCFIFWLLRFRVIRCQTSAFFVAFDFPAWTGPTLVIIMFYFIFTVAIYHLLASDISLSVHAYVNSRSRLVLSNITPAERFIQISQLQSSHVAAAMHRFRHNSGVLKIASHALFKSYAVFATAASASYIVLFVVAFSILVILVLALVRHLIPNGRISLFFNSWNFFPLLTALCKLFAFLVCFSLPMFIQQGDTDSLKNYELAEGADAGCVFYYNLFFPNASRGAAAKNLGHSIQRSDMYCDSTFWTDHLSAYFNGSYPSIFYRCPLRMSFATLWSLPLFALLDLMSDFYSDDFALKNRRVTQYGLGIVFIRNCSKLSHLFTDFTLRLPTFSLLRVLPVAYASIIVVFLLLDPNTYFKSVECRKRAGESSSPEDNQQLAFGSALAGVVMFGLTMSLFIRAITIVRLYYSHFKDGRRLLKAIYKGARVKSHSHAVSSAPFTAKSLLELEQAFSVLYYSRDGLNVLCAFQTSSLSLLFLSLLLPILVYAYLASSFDKDAAYALHDLANLCKNLRERRDCSCVTWDPAKQDSLTQRQEQQDREHEQLRKRRLIKSEMSVNASISVEDSTSEPPLSAATPYDFRDVGAAMSRFSLPLPRMQHFRKQLITPTVGGQRLSVIDHIEALSPADLLALEAVCSRLSENFRLFPRPCRVLSLDVDRAFMAGLFTVVSSLIGSLARIFTR